jgi:hypothetical protein
MESVVQWHMHNPMGDAANDTGAVNMEYGFLDVIRAPEVRLAAALACVAVFVAAFDLLRHTSGM